MGSPPPAAPPRALALATLSALIAASHESVAPSLLARWTGNSAWATGLALGVLSADPRRVPEAELVPEMSYDEACELAYFGAKVLHPRTMAPCVAQGIPIWIRNTFNPTHPGTTSTRWI